ncbi:MAG TPA: hypothetical protein VGE35_02065 [Candidatus Paceibacterota bacterium]
MPPEAKLPFSVKKVAPLDARLKEGVTVLLDVEIAFHSEEEAEGRTGETGKKKDPVPAIWLGLTFERTIQDEKKKDGPKERVVRVAAETQAIPYSTIAEVINVNIQALFAHMLNPSPSESALLLASAVEQIIEQVSIRFSVTNEIIFQLKGLAKDVTGETPAAELVGLSSDFKEIFVDLKKK